MKKLFGCVSSGAAKDEESASASNANATATTNGNAASSDAAAKPAKPPKPEKAPKPEKPKKTGTDKSIEKQLKEDKEKYKSTYRLLLLGILILNTTSTHVLSHIRFIRCWRIRQINHRQANAYSSHKRLQQRVSLFGRIITLFLYNSGEF